jgi:hypothetical protein
VSGGGGGGGVGDHFERLRRISQPNPQMNQPTAASGQTAANPKQGAQPPAFTVSRIAALIGMSKQSVRRSLIRWPASAIVTENGKPASAWSLDALPPVIRGSLVGILHELTQGMGFAPDPLAAVTPAEKRHRYKRRSDAVLYNLSETSKAKIYKWLAEEGLSYKIVRDRIKSQFRVSVSLSALCSFFRGYCSPRILQTGAHDGISSLRIDFTPAGPKLTVIGGGGK